MRFKKYLNYTCFQCLLYFTSPWLHKESWQLL